MKLSFKILLSSTIVVCLFYHPLHAMHPEKHESSSKAPSVKAATVSGDQQAQLNENASNASQSTALILVSASTALLLPPSEPAARVISASAAASAAIYQNPNLSGNSPQPPFRYAATSALEEDDLQERMWVSQSGNDEKSYVPNLSASAAANVAPPNTRVQYAADASLRGREAPFQRQGLDFRLGKFKLGYEFQEISGLCPWALRDYNVQKKPLFSLKIKDSKRKLWEVVLDTSDIEFVTVPFANNEKEFLGQCIDTILGSLNVLQVLFDGHPVVTFANWTSAIERLLTNTPYGLFPDMTYGLVDEKTLIRPSFPWRPKFSPQATIQHPLECTIPLYFSLFGFSSRYMPVFSESLPFRDQFLDAQKTADSRLFERILRGYQQKINGLVFLHALTIVQMGTDEDTTDVALLNESYQSLSKSGQVDAKLKLLLMSRRPFSSMFRDIRAEGDYALYFNKVMRTNNGFFKTPSRFSRTNYAEQIFDLATKAERPLLSLLPLFRQDFLENNRPILEYLLRKGVVSTTMIRNFKEDTRVGDSRNLFSGKPPTVVSLFQDNAFFRTAVQSVQRPTGTFAIDIDRAQVIVVPSRYDVLSPPCFLDTENSMGRLREELTHEEREFGEAIVEIRGISGVQPWFLRKCGFDPELEGEFLKKPTLDKGWREIYNPLSTMEVPLPKELIGIVWSFYRELNPEFRNEALGLFNFLTNFGTDPRHITEVYYMGMPVGLRF